MTVGRRRCRTRPKSRCERRLNGDAGAYFAALEALQPGAGEDGKMVLTIYLCKAVLHIQVVKHRNAAAGADASSDPLEGITEDYRQRALTPHSISINWGPKFAERFTVDEAAALHRRFAILDDKLQARASISRPVSRRGRCVTFSTRCRPISHWKTLSAVGIDFCPSAYSEGSTNWKANSLAFLK